MQAGGDSLQQYSCANDIEKNRTFYKFILCNILTYLTYRIHRRRELSKS